ncbi:MAG: ParB/RepB/Spo0J family partition protein [Lachnospiraceae bacterium]|nr:ParB/RepB/Spo0J family partition protein [Lachnospiraceae bacterium]
MAVKGKGLGKGLDSIITDKRKQTAPEKVGDNGGMVFVSINKVEPSPSQPRRTFDEDKLLELAESIKQHGIIDPLIVQDRKDHYEIIGGERRWRAAKKLGLKEVPVIIKNLTEQQIAEYALIDNIQRDDLNPIDEALAYKKLIDDFGYTQDVVAEKVSKSRVAITNSLRLLKLGDKVRQMLIDGKLSTGHARAILGITDGEKQYVLAQKVFDERLSVRETEKLIKKIQTEKPEKGLPKDDVTLEIIYHDLEEQLKTVMGTKVSIKKKGKDAGKIEIEYYSTEELERITRLLKSIINE